jgi:glycerophosphoryl diester phosphodiesterase
MQTQLTCPACHTPFMGDVHQIIDVGLHPEMKQMLLTGALNVVQCPACGTVTRVGTPFLYHDPEHELFMVYVPMELSMAQNEQEKLIGQLVKRAMDQLPPEQRRGYMFQPQTILNLQTLMEKVLETEGVTPEMMARQRAQSELLGRLLEADRETASQMIAEHSDELDEQFFAMLSVLTESAEQSAQEEALLKLLNLRALLYQKTEYGQRLEAQQLALHKFNREAKAAGGVSPDLLLKHVLANRKDPAVVDSLVQAGAPALNYQFFILLSEKIEKREKAGVDAAELKTLRDHLLAVQQDIEAQSRKIFERASQTLQRILSAEDIDQAIRDSLAEIDDSFMYILSASIAQAEEQGKQEQAQALVAVYDAIRDVLDSQMPPEIQLLNELMTLENDEARRQLLDERSEMLTPEFVELVMSVAEQAAENDRPELSQQLTGLRAMIEARMAT